MPKNKRYRKKNKNKRKKKPYSYIPRLLGNTQVTRMRYVAGATLDPGAAGILSHVFRANGITQVDTTLTQGQPTGFDEFNGFFNAYRILSATCKMTFVPHTTANVNPGVYGVFLDNDASRGYSDYQQIMMSNQSLTNNVRLAGIINGATDMKPTSASYDANKVYKHLSTSRSLLLTGDAVDNPTESQYFNCWYASPDIATNPGAAHFLFQLDYVVEWFDRKLTAISVAPV